MNMAEPSNVVQLATYAARSARETTDTSNSERLWISATVSDTQQSQRAVGSDFIPASRLYGTASDSDLPRLFELSAELIRALSACEHALATDDLFEADDLIMNCKPLFEEVFVLRGLSDAIGLISLKALQACQITAITEAPNLPAALLRATRRMHHVPFMTFEEGSALATEIEKAAQNALALPGYNDIAAALDEVADHQPAYE